MSQGDAYIQNMQIMNSIVAEMKEIPVLPSEVPTDVHALQRVEFPDSGGILTYMDGYDQPYKGFPYFEFVEKIDVIKKTTRGTLSSLYHSFNSRPWYQKALFLLVPWVATDVMRSMLYTFWRAVDRYKIKTLRHCTAIRELHRALSIEMPNESKDSRQFRTQIRDLVCMFLEFDNAYRYRFQDIIVELDKGALEKNVGKEIVRLLEIMQSREKTVEIKDTWTLVKFFLPLYLRFNRKLSKAITVILKEIDLEKVKLEVEDEFFCKPRKDYQFGFM